MSLNAMNIILISLKIKPALRRALYYLRYTKWGLWRSGEYQCNIFDTTLEKFGGLRARIVW